MNLTVSISDEILAGNVGDVSRKILEQVALDGFKPGKLTIAEVRRILGFGSRLQVYEFLASHVVPWVDYDEAELDREVETLRRLVP